MSVGLAQTDPTCPLPLRFQAEAEVVQLQLLLGELDVGLEHHLKPGQPLPQGLLKAAQLCLEGAPHMYLQVRPWGKVDWTSLEQRSKLTCVWLRLLLQAWAATATGFAEGCTIVLGRGAAAIFAGAAIGAKLNVFALSIVIS